MLTKVLQDDAVKSTITIEDVKVEMLPKLIDNSSLVCSTPLVAKHERKVRVRTAKSQVSARRSRLSKATAHLYDLEEAHEPEKQLNVDFGLYQMEEL